MKLTTGLVLAGLASIATAVGAGYGVYRIEEGRIAEIELADANAKAAASDKAGKIQFEQDQITLGDALKNAQAQTKIVTQTKTLIQKVPVYVTQEVDRAFPLPCGFVRLHDAAALGVPPSEISLPAGKSDGDACPVTASFAATIIVQNYGAYSLTTSQLRDLQDWVNQESVATNGQITH